MLYIHYCRGKCCADNVVQQILCRNLLYNKLLYKTCCTGSIVQEGAVQVNAVQENGVHNMLYTKSNTRECCKYNTAQGNVVQKKCSGKRYRIMLYRKGRT